MNLKHLSDATLHAEIHRLNREHQSILVQLLHHLRENERRRLFSAYKYPSLFAYVIGELKYSEDEAARRINAMRLLRDIPAVEEKIASGHLNLTNIVLAQSLFSYERKAGRAMSQKQKIEVLTQLENQSVRSAKKILRKINPEFRKSSFNLEMIEDDSLRERLIKLKGRFAHSHPELDLTGLLHKVCDLAEAQLKPKPARKEFSLTGIKRRIWLRDQSRCTNCGSTFAVQEDHRIPRSAGGRYSIKNLRLLCRSCNQRAAIEFFGPEKMEQYIGG
jgi:5-methylcytosine-specific restriction endonuclease McrA